MFKQEVYGQEVHLPDTDGLVTDVIVMAHVTTIDEDGNPDHHMVFGGTTHTSWVTKTGMFHIGADYISELKEDEDT